MHSHIKSCRKKLLQPLKFGCPSDSFIHVLCRQLSLKKLKFDMANYLLVQISYVVTLIALFAAVLKHSCHVRLVSNTCIFQICSTWVNSLYLKNRIVWPKTWSQKIWQPSMTLKISQNAKEYRVEGKHYMWMLAKHTWHVFFGLITNL